jgi:putative copper resistance protein D
VSDWALVAARLALYLDLGLLFGLPLFAVAVLRTSAATAGPRLGRLLVAVALTGLLLSGLHFLMLTAAMAGTGLAEVDPSLLTMLLHESAVGRAVVVRVAALLLAAGAGIAVVRGLRGGFVAAAVAGGAALATLAWGGHAAATEGGAGILHLAADIVHLLAAGAWLSALFALLFMVVRVGTADSLRSTHHALDGFSAVGIAAVAALLVSGSISAVLLLGLPDPRALLGDPYGRLLVAKLGLFLLMLMLAGLNRTWLTPRLALQVGTGDMRGATTALRVSLAIETAAALAILALVARLGMLAPTGSEI